MRLVLLTLLAACSATAADRQAAIPARFQGEWNTELEHCGTGLNDSRLRISANRIRFYESGGPVVAVVTQGEFDVALISELSGEGETWLSYNYFRLSADHTYLTDVSNSNSNFVRYRCQISAAKSPGLELEGLSLGMTMEEVIYVKSIPSAVKESPANNGTISYTPDILVSDIEAEKGFRDYFRWSYGQYSAKGFSAKYLLVEFSEDKLVTEIKCLSGCKLLGVTIGMSEESVINKLGAPEQEEIRSGIKTIYYPRMQFSVSLSEKKVISLALK